jgi:hypothetical protein
VRSVDPNGIPQGFEIIDRPRIKTPGIRKHMFKIYELKPCLPNSRVSILNFGFDFSIDELPSKSVRSDSDSFAVFDRACRQVARHEHGLHAVFNRLVEELSEDHWLATKVVVLARIFYLNEHLALPLALAIEIESQVPSTLTFVKFLVTKYMLFRDITDGKALVFESNEERSRIVFARHAKIARAKDSRTLYQCGFAVG